MGIECKIHLDKRSEDEDGFKPGDLIRGQVNYTLSNDVNLTKILLSFKGRARCQWEVRSGKTTVSYVGLQDLFTHCVELFAQIESGSDEQKMIPAGSYTQDFQFLLPKNIPYTFEKTRLVYIAYHMKLQFIRPGVFKRNVTFKKTLKVLPFLDLSDYNCATLREPGYFTVTKPHKVFFSKVGEVTARISIPRTAFLPGEIIPVTFDVHNDTKLTLPCVKAKLTKLRIYTATRGVYTAGRQHIKQYLISQGSPTEEISPREQKRITCQVAIPPETLPSLQHCLVVSIVYMLNLKICHPGIHIDARLDVPVVIGSVLERSASAPHMYYDPSQPSTSFYDPAAALMPALTVSSAPSPPPYDSPPSYWEAMQLDDDKADDD